MEQKNCPFCHSKQVKKNGHKHGKQQYYCHNCQRNFIGKQRINNQQLWIEYTEHKQTYAQLAEKYHCSIKTIQRHLDNIEPDYTPSRLTHANIIMDTTYLGRRGHNQFGLMVFLDNSTNSVLSYLLVDYETNAYYRQGIAKIQHQGIQINSITCDGRRGLLDGFGNIPTQLCQFHQIQVINRYLTRNPKHIASIELRQLALGLTNTNKEQFKQALEDWYHTHKAYLNERSVNTETNKSWFTHKRVRSAYHSLKNNQQWLFIYQDDVSGKTPNTTNRLEGLFSELKRQLHCHNGLSYERKLRFIKDFLTQRTFK